MAKLIWRNFLIAVTMVALLVVTGCAKPASAPTPTVAPHKRVDIKILTAKVGSGSYAIGTVLAELINEYSPWLRATALETGGSRDNLLRGKDDPQERRFCLRQGWEVTTTMAQQGKPPFQEKITGQKGVIFMMMTSGCTAFTLDPNIKTPQDLIGKRVAIGVPGSGKRDDATFQLQYCWGIMDKIKGMPVGMQEATDGLMDGLIDAIAGAAMTMVAPGKWTIEEYLTEPWTTKPNAHFIGLTNEQVERAIKESGMPGSYVEVPAGALGAKQNYPVGGKSVHLYWFAYPEMDEDVAYEIARIAHEHYEAFGKAYAVGGGFTPKTMAWLPGESEDDIHPGARKYFKERGIPIYIGGKSPF